MNKTNYQLVLDKTLEQIRSLSAPPTLLLHSCCGPCSTYVLEYLSQYFSITVYYYNPNIYPPEEYFMREREQEDFIRKLPAKYPIHFLAARYDPQEYYEAVKSHEKDPEGGERCLLCYGLRLREAARVAKENGFDYFTTTLSISPHKDSQALNRIGGELAEEIGVKYLFSDFKKRDGFRRSTMLTQEYQMYRQDYCGCVFSYRKRQDP
ncbi:MAG: epoxyqueuosine reductase QueH [Peptoniphilaceae bacterium]|nr:epoxyqueuosine reductase QueH [Peptoniphilaceae bacterium]MDY3075895.1 epoxyqueuosine reductase QueH [Peptoniphilaceae bacterium]MDY5842234.1 epoxyqueuosine reductase QueH [Peptoniphilaceae bacterium]